MHKRLTVAGITNKSLRALMTGLLGGADYAMNQASYDLARLRATASSSAFPGKNSTGSPVTGCGSRYSTPAARPTPTSAARAR